jgi:predicted transcriptional regulator of viral defense system
MSFKEICEHAKEIFLESGGILRTSEAIRLGIHPRTLYAMRDEGMLIQVSRGLYRIADLEGLTEPDLVAVALRVPRAVICLISALAYHDITSEIPHEVHIALPRSVKTPRLDHPPTKVYRFSGKSLSEGIEEQHIDGTTVRIYVPEKTVADCFKFRNKIGTDVAIEALKLCMERKGSQPKEILKFARICGVERVMTPYLESLL